MNRQPIDLGFILRQFPGFDFSMAGFGGRLRAQKFVYLLQAFDVYLGYEYSWYLRGPYCSTLAASGSALEGFYGDIPEGSRMRFVSPGANERFERFKGFIGGRESDAGFLEMAATLHFLEMGVDMPRDQIFQRVLSKRPDFSEAECRRVQSHLGDWGIIPGDAPPASGPGPVCAYGDAPRGTEWFVPAGDIPDSMDHRPFDKGLYHMLLDSKEGNEKIVLVGRNVFRPGPRRPPVDEISVDDKRLLVDLIQRG